MPANAASKIDIGFGKLSLLLKRLIRNTDSGIATRKNSNLPSTLALLLNE